MYLYPFNPSINETGGLNPFSIHPKKYEIALTLITTAFTSLILHRTTPLKVTLIGTAVVGFISHLFWTKLGHWVPNKLADEKCIRAFSTKSVINVGLARRVLNDNSLHATLFNRLSSEPDSKKRCNLLNHYFLALWPHIPLQERRAIYLTMLEKMAYKKLTNFQPTEISQFYMWTTLPIPDSDTARLLAINFNPNATLENGKTVKEGIEFGLWVAKSNHDWEAEAARSLHSFLLFIESPFEIYERDSLTGRAILQSSDKTVKELLLRYVKPEQCQ